jgi:hypothetical protein
VLQYASPKVQEGLPRFELHFLTPIERERNTFLFDILQLLRDKSAVQDPLPLQARAAIADADEAIPTAMRKGIYSIYLEMILF